MIDEKKIGEAAGYHLYDVRAAYADQEIGSYAYPTDIRDIEQQVRDDFKEGARWALQEFKKSLWHDASEEPEKGKKLIGYDLDGYSIYCWTDQEATWKEFVYNSTLQKWCYIDDLLPKEGGEG